MSNNLWERIKQGSFGKIGLTAFDKNHKFYGWGKFINSCRPFMYIFLAVTFYGVCHTIVKSFPSVYPPSTFPYKVIKVIERQYYNLLDLEIVDPNQSNNGVFKGNDSIYFK